MEILVDPNVSYILLLFGFLIAVLALFAPGTGILEIFALFILAAAGYGIANLSINWWAIIIILAGVIPFILAFRRPQKTRILLLVFCSLAFVAGSAYLFPGKGWLPGINLVLVILMAPIVVGLTWLIAQKSLEAARVRPNFDLNQIIGMTGQVSSDIRGQGSVYVNGENWTASSKVFIPAGAQVRVLRRRGLVLEVEPLNS